MQVRIVGIAGVVAIAHVATGLSVAAPSANAQRPSLIPIPYRTYVAINPLGIPFDVASVEVESGIAQGVTLGGQGSYTSLGDDHYTTADAKVRYYPSEVVLRGFSLGVSAGLTHFTTRKFESVGVIFPGSNTAPTETNASLNFGTIGLLLDYNWMLGSQHRFIVGTGIGAKRVLAGSDARSAVGLDQAYATGRFVVGLAF